MARAGSFRTLVLFLTIPISISFGQNFFSGDQAPRLNQIDQTDGLPHNSVSSIQQDVRGFLWFGTQGGLAQYDGRSFHLYKNALFDETSLPHDIVQTIYYAEEDDTLWVGTYRGLAMHRLGESGFTSFQHDPADTTSLSDDVVIAVVKGPAGDIWVGTQSGLNRMNEDGSFERIEIPGEIVRALFVDSRDRLWIGTLDGLYRWNETNDEIERVDFGWDSPHTMTIAETKHGDLLLGTWGAGPEEGGLVEVDLKEESFRQWRFDDNRTYTVLAGSDGTYWVGTWGGGLFAITSDGRLFSFRDEHADSLSSPVVYSLFEDEAGLVWVGTNGGGIHYMSPRQRNFRKFFHNQDDPTTLPEGKINAIYRDRTGILWVGLYSGGLARYDEANDQWIDYDTDPENPFALVNDIVTDIFEDSRRRLWIGTNGGLQMYERESDRFLLWGRDIYQRSAYSGEIVYRIAEDNSDNLWIGTYHGGLTRVDIETGETAIYTVDATNPRSLSNNLIYDICLDSRGDLWIATNGGLNRWNPATEDFTVYRYDPNNSQWLTSNAIQVLFEDSRGEFWIGTINGGLNRFDRDRERFAYLTASDGLSDNSIISILEDDDGRLWLGTQRGLTVYDPSNGSVETLDERDGLYGSEFQTGAFKDIDGTLFFGANHGITAIGSSVTFRNFHPPHVQIVDVQVFQESVDPDRVSFNDSAVTLNASENFVGFEFVGLDFESPANNRYAYQLAGFDREPIDVGSRNYATYTNVPPGEYEFLVWAANGDGVWTNEPARLSVRIIAPWYLQWWAYAIYIAATLFVVFAGLRWRTAAILAHKNRALEYANAQLERASAEFERLSVRDALTGIFNRRYFDSRLREEWFRARRSGCSLSLLMIDVDHFKRFNDVYGHIVGDQALVATAQVMEAGISRTTDFVARYGGEEFVALLYDTPLKGARTIAERIRLALMEHPLSTGTEQVTVSVGVCTIVAFHDEAPDALTRCADDALYAAKRNGRNRVECSVIDGTRSV